MNPNPFEALNHFTVPVSFINSLFLLATNPTNHLRESRNCLPWKVGVPDGSSDRQEFVCSQIITEPPGFVNKSLRRRHKSLRRNLTNHATEFPPLLRGCPNVIAGRPSGRLGILVLASLLGNGAVLSDPGGRPFRRSHQMIWFVHYAPTMISHLRPKAV